MGRLLKVPVLGAALVMGGWAAYSALAAGAAGGALPKLDAVHFINGRDGYAVQTRPFALLATSTGGVTWRLVQAPMPSWQFSSWGWANAGPVWVEAQAVTPGGNRYGGPRVGNGRLWIQGRHDAWTVHTLAPSVGTVTGSVGSHTVFAYRVSGMPGQGGEDLTLWRSDDAGLRWRRVSRMGAAGQLGGAFFATKTRGWVFGFESGVYWSFYATGDGGQSWQRATLPLPAGFKYEPVGIVTAPTFCSPPAGYLIIQVIAAPAGHGYSLVYRTADGGRTWAYDGRVGSFAVAGCSADAQPYVLTGADVYLAQAGRLRRIGQSGKVHVLDVLSPATWIGARYSPRATASTLYETRNGGRNWQPLRLAVARSS